MKVTHKHHIIPRHMGGSDDPKNLIELTIEEHAEAHHVLFEKYSKFEDYLAWRMLSGKTEEKEILRQKLANINFQKMLQDPELKKKWTNKISKSLTGKKQSAETKKKRSDTLKKAYKEGRVNTANLWKNPYSPTKEDQKKMAEGRRKSKIWNEKVRSKETQEKKRLSSKNRVQVKIDDVIYNSIREASSKTDIKYHVLLSIRARKTENNRVIFL